MDGPLAQRGNAQGYPKSNGRAYALTTTTNYGSYPVLNVLADREQVKYLQHVAGNVTVLGN